jgi:hypothetical protein
MLHAKEGRKRLLGLAQGVAWGLAMAASDWP